MIEDAFIVYCTPHMIPDWVQMLLLFIVNMQYHEDDVLIDHNVPQLLQKIFLKSSHMLAHDFMEDMALNKVPRADGQDSFS